MNRAKTAERIMFVVSLLVLGVMSMGALTSTPVLVQTPKLMVVQLPTAGVTPQALGPTPGANGTKVTGLWATNIDSTRAMVVQITVLRSAVNYLMTTVSVPLSSGNTAAAVPVNLMTSTTWPGLPIDSDGNPYFILNSGDQLQANVTVAPTPAAVTIVANAGDF